MSLKYEQYRSLKMTREFMRDLLDTKESPRTIKNLKERASACLHHFPILDVNGKPIFSKDWFTKD